jgi:hypothetical protein
VTQAPEDPAVEGADYSISLVRANLYGVPLFLFLAAAAVVPYGVVWGWTRLFLAFNEFMNWQRFIPAIVLGTIAHEGLHGAGWALFGRLPFRTIRYGFNVKTVTPFAHCPVPLRASAYRAGTLLPGLLLGGFPALAAVVTGNGFMIIFSAFFLGAASGDFLCLWIMRAISPDAQVTDHPTRAGCVVAASGVPGSP